MMDAPHGHIGGPLAIAGGIVLAIAAFLAGRSRASGLKKHRSACARRAIEHALAAPGCAVAHSVSNIARAGTIDHLVATPVRLWVVGAVDRDVTREELLRVIARLADNTTAVWDWAPPGTPVRGCLLLGHESRQHRNQYDYGKGPVVVRTPATLARELMAEASLARDLDERVAHAVAKLDPVSG